MKVFLKKMEEKVTVMEKYFDDDNKRNASLNKFLYEYEVYSVRAYGQVANMSR
jgi:hypothetical protein